MKKILCIIQLPPPINGVTTMNSALVNSKKIKNSYALDIVPFNFVSNMADIGRINIAKIFLMIKIWFTILFKLMSNKYDAVYFTLNLTGIAFYRDIFYICLFKIFNTKPIYHLYGRGLVTSYKPTKRKIALYKWIFNKATVIMQSKLLYDSEMQLFIKENQLHIVTNGIIPSSKNNFIKEENPAPKILFLAVMARFKGPLILLEALKILAEKKIKFKATFIGAPFDIPEEEFSSLIQQYRLTDFVQYLGIVSQETKQAALNNSDIFVLPTINDAFPLVLLEAMEAGLPIISTIEGAIPEIIDDSITGYLVKKYDISELSDKIEKLLKDNNLRKQMGSNGKQKFLNNYTITSFEENMVTIFDQVCKHE